MASRPHGRRCSIDTWRWGRSALTYVGMTPAQFEEIVNHIGVHAAGEVVILSCAYLRGPNSEKWSEVRALGIPWQLKNWNGLSALQASYNATVMWSAATDDSAVAIPSDSAARASAVLSDVLACAEGWCDPLVALLQSKSGGGALDVRHATMVGNDKTPWLRIPLRGMKKHTWNDVSPCDDSPTVGFHGTRWPKLSGILASGRLRPGQRQAGKTHGIWTASDMQRAEWYAWPEPLGPPHCAEHQQDPKGRRWQSVLELRLLARKMHKKGVYVTKDPEKTQIVAVLLRPWPASARPRLLHYMPSSCMPDGTFVPYVRGSSPPQKWIDNEMACFPTVVDAAPGSSDSENEGSPIAQKRKVQLLSRSDVDSPSAEEDEARFSPRGPWSPIA